MNLYQMESKYQQLLDKEEYTKEDMEALELLPGLIEDKLIARAYVVRNLEYLIAGINCELSNMIERRDKLQSNLDKLNISILDSMQLNNIKQIDKCPNFKIAIHKKKARVDAYDREKIPFEFWIKEEKIINKLNTNLVHEFILQGKDVPGAKLVDPFKLVIK